MPIAQTFVPELDNEMQGTRKVLERVPQDRLSWTPHSKSMPLGRLASHVAELVGWIPMMFTSTEYDLMPGGAKYVGADCGTVAEMAELLERNCAAAREQLTGASDEAMGESWALLANGHEIFRAPRAVVYRGLVNHVIHHRAQLTVYLRMLDVPLPPLYGPTADESPFG